MKRMIAKLPSDSRHRVNVVAGILRGLIASDDKAEVELALTLILAELSAR